MEIEVWSDIVCPFCYIGKRQLEAALEHFEHADEVLVHYRSYELNPEAPKHPTGDLHHFLAAHRGVSPAEAKQMNAGVADYAASVGLNYDLDHAIPANSFDAHRLVHLAAVTDRQDQMIEALHEAYFIDAVDLNDHDNLLGLAVKAGLDRKEATRVMASDAYAAEVRADEAEAQRLGIKGVPTFLIDRQTAVTGAQPSEVVLAALRRAWTNRSS